MTIYRALLEHEVAKLCGVHWVTLKRWKARGTLRLAPKGRPGDGRGNELWWSKEAVQEAVEHSKNPMTAAMRSVRKGARSTSTGER